MRQPRSTSLRLAASSLAAAATLVLCGTASAATVEVKVTVHNLAPTNSISFAPLRLGFNPGSFDAFYLGQVSTAQIISVAGLLTPGATLSASFMVDTALNKFFTFGAMVVPSNDFFIGNDSPTEYRLFDNAGHLRINQIGVRADEIWDAGSEAFDPLNAAFIVGGTNSLRTPQNSVVALNFAELAGFNGLTTGAGYVFSSGLRGDSDVYRISFAVAAVPEPETYALMLAGLATLGWVSRRRRAV